jgi:hypothetical protein
VNKLKRDNSFVISLKVSTEDSHRRRCKWKYQAQAWRTSRHRGTWPFPRNPSRRRNQWLGFIGKVGEAPIAVRSRESCAGFKPGGSGKTPGIRVWDIVVSVVEGFV